MSQHFISQFIINSFICQIRKYTVGVKVILTCVNLHSRKPMMYLIRTILIA